MLLQVLLIGALAAASPLTPEDAVRHALENDPALAGRRAELDAALGLQRQTLFLGRNPEVEYTTTRDGSRVTGSITQPFSLTGEGIHARKSARARLAAARATTERGRFETAAAVRRAYARAVLGRELLKFAESDKALIDRLRGVVESRVAAGEGADLDLRLARLEQSRAIATWLEAQAQATESDLELASLIGRRPGDLATDPIVAGPPAPGTTQPRSDVLAARATTRSAHAALSRERAAVLPTLGLGAFYEKDDGSRISGPAVTLEVPLWNWNQSGIGAARGDLRLAQAIERATEARAETEAVRAGERLRVAEESVAALPPDIASESGPARRSIERLFATGESNLSDALVLRSRIVEGERAWVEARAAVAIARIDVALANQSTGLIP